MKKSNDTLLQLLHVVIDNYISKGEPIGSKFLSTMEWSEMDYAPSTLRKYLQQLESSWLVYQPYNSSGRIPTVQGLSSYLDTFLSELTEEKGEESWKSNYGRILTEWPWSDEEGVTGRRCDGVTGPEK